MLFDVSAVKRPIRKGIDREDVEVVRSEKVMQLRECCGGGQLLRGCRRQSQPQPHGDVGRNLGLDAGYMGAEARVDLRPGLPPMNIGAVGEMHFAG